MSTLGKTTVIIGDVQSSEDLTIEGTIEGHVRCEFHAIVLAPTAHVAGEVIGRDITITGQASGQIVATDVVDIRGGADVTAKVLAPRFILHPDAFFKGRVEPQHVEAAIRVSKFNQSKR